MKSLRVLPLLTSALLSAMAVTVSSCKEDNPVAVADVDPARTPTMLTRNVETLISDSGVVRYRITTPVWYIYDEADEPYWRFPDGVNLEKFDLLFRKEATVSSDSATYFKNKQIWRLDGHVDIANVMGEKFLTQQLYWDQKQRKLYSDSFIHIDTQDKVLEGYGFDSNEQLTRYTIRRVSGIFPAKSLRSEGHDPARTDSARAASGVPTATPHP